MLISLRDRENRDKRIHSAENEGKRNDPFHFSDDTGAFRSVDNVWQKHRSVSFSSHFQRRHRSVHQIGRINHVNGRFLDGISIMDADTSSGSRMSPDTCSPMFVWRRNSTVQKRSWSSEWIDRWMTVIVWSWNILSLDLFKVMRSDARIIWLLSSSLQLFLFENRVHYAETIESICDCVHSDRADRTGLACRFCTTSKKH